MKQAGTRYAVPSLEPSKLRGVRDVNKATGGLLGPRRQGAEGSPEERALPGRNAGAGGRNRTDETCLEGRSFTTKLRPRWRPRTLPPDRGAVKRGCTHALPLAPPLPDC